MACFLDSLLNSAHLCQVMIIAAVLKDPDWEPKDHCRKDHCAGDVMLSIFQHAQIQARI